MKFRAVVERLPKIITIIQPLYGFFERSYSKGGENTFSNFISVKLNLQIFIHDFYSPRRISPDVNQIQFPQPEPDFREYTMCIRKFLNGGWKSVPSIQLNGNFTQYYWMPHDLKRVQDFLRKQMRWLTSIWCRLTLVSCHVTKKNWENSSNENFEDIFFKFFFQTRIDFCFFYYFL